MRDIDRAHLDPADLLGLAHDLGRGVEAHGLAVQQGAGEGRGMAVFDPRGDIDQLREAGGVAFREAIRAEALDLFEAALRERWIIAARDHPPDHPRLIGVQAAVAAKSAHGLAQAVGLTVAELGGDDGQLHRLLLEQGHAEGLVQNLFEFVGRAVVGRRRRIDDLFLLVSPPQIGMDHVALDRAGADDGDLDHQVIEAAGPQPGQHVDLGSALDLKDANGLASAQHVVDPDVVARDRGQVVIHVMVGAHQVEGLADAGQHPERQHIDLHQAQGVDVILVPLDEGALRHGRVADGDHFVQPVLGQDETPDMLTEVAGEVQQAHRHFDRAGDHGVGDVQTGLNDVAIADLGSPTAPVAGGQTGGDVFGQAQGLADLADGATGAEVDDGGGDARAMATVAFVDVLDDLLASFVFEIDVDVGRFVAVLGQEALEQQIGFHRVHRGDAQDVADRRVRRRAPSLAQDALVPRHAHDVEDGQEVGGDFLAADEGQFLVQQGLHLVGNAVGITHGGVTAGQVLQPFLWEPVGRDRLFRVLIAELRQVESRPRQEGGRFAYRLGRVLE
ncbi:hypothetical protein D3C86_1109410 [compost metagenome]